MFAQLQAQIVERHGRHLAVQARELGDPVGAEQVGAAGEDLAELDEGGTELLHRQPHLHRRIEPRQVGRVVAVQHVAGLLERIGQAEAAHRVAESVADEDAGDLVEPAQVARRAEGLDQHGASVPR